MGGNAPIYEVTGQLQPHLADNFHSEDGEVLINQEDEDVYLVAEPRSSEGGD